MTAPRVVITAAGLAIPAGLSPDAAAAAAVEGRSAIGPLRRFDASGHACQTAGEVPAFDPAAVMKAPKNAKFLTAATACAMRAAADAVAASGLASAAIDAARFGVYTGSGQTGLEPAEFFAAMALVNAGDEAAAYRELGGRASRLVDRYWSLRTLANAGLGLLAAECGAHGSCNNFVQGDTASAHALAAGYHDLVEGRCDAVLAGGYDSLLTVSTYLAYERMGLLSGGAPERAYRPFDRDRNGLVLGEGAAFVVLERLDDARARGAAIYGELVGAGFAQAGDSADAAGTRDALRRAIRDAAGDARPDVIVADGIGTRADDLDEARTLADLGFDRTPVTAFKGLTGYLGAATGAVELCLAMLTARAGTVPAIAGLATPDPECRLDLVASAPRRIGPDPLVLALTWSWTGQCAALAARAMAE